MPEEIEEIMDESESYRPGDALRNSSNADVLLLLPREYRKAQPTRMFLQFIKYKGRWVVAGFREGDGALHNDPEDCCEDSALFIYPINMPVDYVINEDCSQNFIVKEIQDCLNALFKEVNSPRLDPDYPQEVSFYVRGIRKCLK